MDSSAAEVALITGASSGIGRACAFRFAREGYSVALVARRKEALDEAVQAIEEEGGRASAFPADLTQDGGVSTGVSGGGSKH